MNKKNNLRLLVLNITLLVLIIATTAVYAGTILTPENVTVHNGIRLIIDGEELHPKDVDGNDVDMFVLNGTTYLPVRAISNVFEKRVAWDGENKIVYLGEVPGEETFMRLESYYKAGHDADERLVWEKEHMGADGTIRKNVVYPMLNEPDTSEGYVFENEAPYGNSYVSHNQGGDEYVMLDGQYTRFKAEFFVPKEAMEHEFYTSEDPCDTYSEEAGLTIVVTYLSGATENRQVFDKKIKRGDDPILIDLDMTNVKSVNFWMLSGQSHDGEAVQGMLADPTFYK